MQGIHYNNDIKYRCVTDECFKGSDNFPPKFERALVRLFYVSNAGPPELTRHG